LRDCRRADCDKIAHVVLKGITQPGVKVQAIPIVQTVPVVQSRRVFYLSSKGSSGRPEIELSASSQR